MCVLLSHNVEHASQSPSGVSGSSSPASRLQRNGHARPVTGRARSLNRPLFTAQGRRAHTSLPLLLLSSPPCNFDPFTSAVGPIEVGEGGKTDRSDASSRARSVKGPLFSVFTPTTLFFSGTRLLPLWCPKNILAAVLAIVLDANQGGLL